MPEKKIPLLDRKKGLYLHHVKGAGRGVFCTQAIKAGEVLERTPAIILDPPDTERIGKTLLERYVFSVGKLPKAMGVKNSEDVSCVVMGIASFCNHSDERPNAQVVWEQKGGTLYYILEATRDIPKGTEICTSYGPGWFEDHHPA